MRQTRDGIRENLHDRGGFRVLKEVGCPASFGTRGIPTAIRRKGVLTVAAAVLEDTGGAPRFHAARAPGRTERGTVGVCGVARCGEVILRQRLGLRRDLAIKSYRGGGLPFPERHHHCLGRLEICSLRGKQQRLWPPSIIRHRATGQRGSVHGQGLQEIRFHWRPGRSMQRRQPVVDEAKLKTCVACHAPSNSEISSPPVTRLDRRPLCRGSYSARSRAPRCRTRGAPLCCCARGASRRRCRAAAALIVATACSGRARPPPSSPLPDMPTTQSTCARHQRVRPCRGRRARRPAPGDLRPGPSSPRHAA